MTSTTKATTFVTGAAGFIGTALVRVLLALGHRVYGSTPSRAQHVRRVGAVPAMGDLLDPTLEQGLPRVLGVLHE